MAIRRTLPPLLLSFVSGILCARFGPKIQNTIVLFAACAALVAVILVQGLRGKKSIVTPLVLFFLLGSIAYKTSSPVISDKKTLTSLYNTRNVIWTGEIVSYPEFKKYGTIFVLSVEAAQLNGKKYAIKGLVQINVKKLTKNWWPGIKVVSSFILRDFRNFQDPGSFDYKSYMRRKGYIGKSYLPSDGFLTRIASHEHPWAKTIGKIRSRSFYFLMHNVPRPENAIFAALLLGMKKGVPEYLKAAFNLTGVSHILAISGLHLGLLGGILYFLFSYLFSTWEWAILKFGKTRLALLCTLPFVLFYAEITGLSIPTRRAVLMAMITLVALLVKRSRDFWQILSLAALLILMDQPGAVFSPSFQLSFCALAAIVFLTPEFKRLLGLDNHEFKTKFMKRICDAFFVSLSACLGVAPLLAYHFHMVSFMGIVANLFVIPLIGFIALPLGLLAITAAFADPSLGSAIIWPGTRALHLTLKLILKLSELRAGVLYLPHLSVFSVLLLYLLGFVLFARISLNKKLPALALVIVSIVLLTYRGGKPPVTGRKGTLEVTVLDVGRGATMLIRFPTGHRMLVEGGNYSWSTFNIGKHVIAPFLWHRKIKTIDYLLLASIYPRCSSLPFVAESFVIRELWNSGVGLRGYAFRETFRNLKKRHCIKRTLPDFRNVRIGKVGIRVLSPSLHDVHWAPEPPYFNFFYMALRLKFKKTALYLLPYQLPPGKVGPEEIEKDTASKKVVIFYGKLPDDKVTGRMIKLINPGIAVFTPYAPGLCEKGTFSGLEKAWYSTRKNGSIIIITDGNSVKIKTFRHSMF